MIPPRTKSLICHQVQKYVIYLKSFKNSNPVIMLGQLKLDRIDHKLLKQSQKLNHREFNKNIKLQQGNKKYEKRKAAITYRSYTVEFKRKLIENIKQINIKSNAGLSKIVRIKAKQLNIHPKNIFRWFHTKQIKKKQGGRKALYPQMQQRLAQFIINNPKMKRKHILRQAKKIMQQLNISGREYFNFSKGWYQRFRQRLIRKKIIPGNIKKNKQYHDQSDSDYDDSQSSMIKKEQDHTNIKKEQYHNNIKQQQQQGLYDVIIKQEYNQNDYYDSQFEEEDQSMNWKIQKYQKKKKVQDKIIPKWSWTIIYSSMMKLQKLMMMRMVGKKQNVKKICRKFKLKKNIMRKIINQNEQKLKILLIGDFLQYKCQFEISIYKIVYIYLQVYHNFTQISYFIYFSII